ncbi:hypothetical protein B0H63DRAFT_480774 [Podospora didyma]|uniref:DUF676 domain-containing protein n=1 Tax=Podospora didyma TaxID=330526 RepID=A0AAE0KEJ9_9PEZI|nr:hypothetical protein B0H63DRAFT_480774 [Podospora didyma]
MGRILLLCFLHGFKGNDDTFGNFPKHLQDTVTNNLPDHKVTSVVYPKYETRGELAASTDAFLGWLRERVMELRKQHLQNPWPPNDRDVGVILIAHSMGGFVASDCLFRVLDDRRNDDSASGPIFPLIQGILAFDTPYNGLARSLFVYGAFSNYQKVSNVFNAMAALSAAAPAGIARLASKRATSRIAASSAVGRGSSSPAWKAWQLVAVRTGTVGAIAAGGVAAYMHRKEILEAATKVRTLKKEDVVQGYQQSVDALGQGLAYINRGNVGTSFAWLSDHFTFVGSLLKQNELNRRLERLAALKGVGIKDFYASLGENGYWSGGYFVPERTFCAIPAEKDQPGEAALFSRHVIAEASDEIVAHMNLFKPDKNKEYEKMTNDAAQLVIEWFKSDQDIYDDPKFAEAAAPAESAETEMLANAVEGGDHEKLEEKSKEVEEKATADAGEDDGIPDESPIDIAAAASLVPLPDADLDAAEENSGEKPDIISEQKKAYMAHLFGIAQTTGSSLWSYVPSKMPSSVVDNIPSISMPTALSNLQSSMPSVSMPRGISLFSRKPPTASETAAAAEASASDGKVPLPTSPEPTDERDLHIQNYDAAVANMTHTEPENYSGVEKRREVVEKPTEGVTAKEDKKDKAKE